MAKFIWTVTEKNMNLALKTYWIFSGYEKDCQALKECDVWVTMMKEQVEARMLNGDKRALKAILSTCEDPTLILNEKVNHLDYVTLQNEFIEKLIKNTIKLKEVSIHSRLGALQKFFASMNRWIEKKVRGKNIEANSKFQKYYKGVMIPLDIGADADPVLIVNIVSSLGHCYNTRKRAPYKIAFETIKLSEADSWEEKVLIKSNRFTFREELKEEDVKLEPSIKRKQTLDDLFSYKMELKGFKKFARLMKEEEKKLKLREHNRTLQKLLVFAYYIGHRDFLLECDA